MIICVLIPGLFTALQPWEWIKKSRPTLKGLGGWQTLSGFNDYFCVLIPGLFAALPTLG